MSYDIAAHLELHGSFLEHDEPVDEVTFWSCVEEKCRDQRSLETDL